MKKILKYISLFIGIVIFLWFSYGLYLHINLPKINITDKEVLINTEYATSDHPKFYDTFQNFVPEDRIFHNKQIYEIFPIGLPEFTYLLNPNREYSLCFSGIDKSYQIHQMGIGLGKSKVKGIDYLINPHALKEDDILFTKIFDKNSYPYKFSLIRGKNCSKNIISRHKAEIKKKNNKRNFTIIISQIK
jgi:hypothetical protein